MTKKILVPLLLLTTISANCQNSKFSVEVNYPLPLGDNFIKENYQGIVDLGVKYRFYSFEIG